MEGILKFEMEEKEHEKYKKGKVTKCDGRILIKEVKEESAE